uniref:Uncharacterized protein n=1 Tax=Arundo donax TaxID=35708 RepID=A0A0A8YWV9_ARUDO
MSHDHYYGLLIIHFHIISLLLHIYYDQTSAYTFNFLLSSYRVTFADVNLGFVGSW